MRITDKKDYPSYLYKVYSSWLGKIIGIRLGAPVEGWTDEKIKEKYHDRHGYLLDYGIFAADDDSNGPLFFVRALLKKNEITSEDIGNVFLNYIQEYSGFFWWGGVGVSSEHTAYENLKNGIKAPHSGSIEKNGLTIAEQIGGQIFSDCWGYVSGYDCDLAKELAIKASRVTHDGNGVQGAIFVAVAITLAMKEKDIYSVIDGAMEYLDKDMEYYQVMKIIKDFYNEHPEDYHLCFRYIKDNYGYDKYPGVCHIIPNSCLMMMAMCYGEGGFDKTMEMLNNCGWDTDCNCGNVGSILGALVGVRNIDSKWIEPINDILNASSCIGSENITTVSESAKLFSRLAFKLNGIEINDERHFDLPYATEGFFGDCKADEGLKCKGEVYKYSYYLGDDIYDSRYDPEFSPTIYPGYTIKVKADKDIVVFAETLNGKRYEAVNSLKIPSGTNLFIHKYGFKTDEYTVKDIVIEHTPELDYDFKDYKVDVYGPRYEGDSKYNLRGFVKHHGKYELENGLKLNGLITSGSLYDRYSEIDVELTVLDENYDFSIIFNCTGYMHYSAIRFNNGRVSLTRKDNEENVFSNSDFFIEKGHKILLKTRILNGRIILCDFSESYVDLGNINELYGLVGLSSRNGSAIRFLGLKLQ